MKEKDGRIERNKELLTNDERDRIIQRAHSVFAWVGNLIPDKEKFNGVEIDLRNVVFKLRTKKDVTDDDRELAYLLGERIKDRKRELEEHLRHDKLTKKAAMQLLDQISGLVKAINDLHDIEYTDELSEKKNALMSRIDDEKRWQKYLRQIRLGSGYDADSPRP